MKTYEVRFLEEDGTITSAFFRAGSVEALYEYLCDVCPDADIVGYAVVGG